MHNHCHMGTSGVCGDSGGLNKQAGAGGSMQGAGTVGQIAHNNTTTMARSLVPRQRRYGWTLCFGCTQLLSTRKHPRDSVERAGGCSSGGVTPKDDTTVNGQSGSCCTTQVLHTHYHLLGDTTDPDLRTRCVATTQ